MLPCADRCDRVPSASQTAACVESDRVPGASQTEACVESDRVPGASLMEVSSDDSDRVPPENLVYYRYVKFLSITFRSLCSNYMC